MVCDRDQNPDQIKRGVEVLKNTRYTFTHLLYGLLTHLSCNHY